MVQEELLEIIHSDFLSGTFPVIPSYDKYKNLELKVTELEKTGKEIQEQFDIEKSIPRKIKVIAKRKLLKIQSPNLDVLLDNQIKNITSLGYWLNLINNESRKELKKQETHYDDISENFEKRVKSIEQRRFDLVSLIEEFKTLHLEFSETKKSDSDYFSKERQLRKIEYQLVEEKHQYVMNNDWVVSLSQEKKSYETIYRFLRNSVYVCERVNNKLASMKNHIQNTREVYKKLRQQQKAISSLKNAVSLIANNSSSIQENLSKGLIEVNSMLTEPDFINEFYNSPILKEANSQVEESNNYNDREIDELIHSYLSS